MDQEQWTIWSPQREICLAKKYDLDAIHFDYNGLFLFLSECRSEENAIRVEFPGFIYGFRCHEELSVLDTLAAVVDKDGNDIAAKWTFFIVKNSQYAKRIADECHGTLPVNMFKHFAFITSDGIFDVVTDADPEIFERPYGDFSFPKDNS